ncbi:hypothetical protein [Sporosarcina sp. E16_8]|uniref:hypothetical protein n=1 Tax=Sporosarcina sp. E16_8 TaxID=2789295 RepID=UPI001A927B3A|nr:hypothetical protein [Sporosarcina sp. E16_8]MBO0588888.1 hypothetical protein [Sporosarcina sp. E16_8]
MIKLKKYISKFSYKKIGLLLGALLLTISLGSGMNRAFAGQDVGSSLINWLGAKKTVSEQEISEAITSEKNRLMDELKIALQDEKNRAEEELAAFTEDEKLKRTSALREYAATLKENMKTDLTEEKEAIIADLDAQYNQTVQELNKPTSIKPKPGSEIKPGPASETEVKPDSTPESEAGIQSELTPKTDAETNPEPAPETEVATKPDPTLATDSAQ